MAARFNHNVFQFRPAEIPVVNIYISEYPEFAIIVKKDVSIDSLKETSSVLVLDLSHPENEITGFAILDITGSGGRFLFVLVLLSIILAGNYFIFFRERETRQKVLSYLKDIKLKPSTKEEKLTRLLDQVIDLLNSGQVPQALSHYESVFSLYEKVEESLKHELKPILDHMRYELELYDLNKTIKRTYNQTVRGCWDETIEGLNLVHMTLDSLPEYYQKRVSKDFKRLNLSVQIHKLKEQNSPDMTVDDSLFGVKE